VISIFLLYFIIFLNKNVNAVFGHVTQKRVIYKYKEDLIFMAALITITLRLYGSVLCGYIAAVRANSCIMQHMEQSCKWPL